MEVDPQVGGLRFGQSLGQQLLADRVCNPLFHQVRLQLRILGADASFWRVKVLKCEKSAFGSKSTLWSSARAGAGTIQIVPQTSAKNRDVFMAFCYSVPLCQKTRKRHAVF